MDRYNNNQGLTAETLADMFPEVYNRLHPLVASAADEMRRDRRPLTSNMLDDAVDDVVRRSGMWDEDDPAEAYPVQAGFGRRPIGRIGRGHHNRNTLRDIARILFLRELLLG